MKWYYYVVRLKENFILIDHMHGMNNHLFTEGFFFQRYYVHRNEQFNNEKDYNGVSL